MNQDPSSVSPQSTPAPSARKNTRRTVALWLLIAPTALIIGSIALYTVVGFLIHSSSSDLPPELATPQPLIKTVANIFLYIAALVGFLTWLPGLITGIILLTTKGKDANN